jgi:hypothetical protein
MSVDFEMDQVFAMVRNESSPRNAA